MLILWKLYKLPKLFFALFLLVYGLTGCRSISKSESELGVTGGTPNDSKFPGAVGISMGADLCSGTFVRHDLLMTAAHCLQGRSAVKVMSPNPALANKTSIGIDIHPDYMHEDASETSIWSDIGFARFPSGTAPADVVTPLSKTAPKVGDTVELLGYGINPSGSSEGDKKGGIRRYGKNRIAELNSQKHIIIIKTKGGGSQGGADDSLADLGDSGSGLYNSAGELIGIASMATSHVHAWYVDISYTKSRSYINSVLGADKGAKSSPSASKSAQDAGGSAKLPSSSSPLCQTSGFKGAAYSLSYVPESEGQGYMKKASGSGFSCKTEANETGEQYMPTCSEACPDEGSDSQGAYGWCAKVAGFACRP